MITVDVKGGAEAEALLARLSRAEGRQLRNACRRAVRKHLAPLRTLARANVPVKTGRLRKAIKLKEWRKAARGEVGSRLVVDPGATRADPHGAFYGMMVEQGHLTRGGKFVPGAFFLTRAYAAGGQAAGQAAARDIGEAIDEVVR